MAAPSSSVWAVVLAAGAATRFGARKQFEDLGGMRLVDRAVVSAGRAADGCVVVLPAGVAWDGPTVTDVVVGGATRVDSVRAGLSAVPLDADVVVIHDAAHPLAAPALFDAVVARVRDGYDGAVPVVPVRETVMRVADNVVADAVDRRGLHAVQMPHAFSAAALRDAHRSGVEANDDTSLLFVTGRRVATVPGDPLNVHVTTPAELDLARRLLDAGPVP